MKKIFSISAVLLLLFVASNSNVFAFSGGPPNGLTGAPSENNCMQCHAGNALDAAGGSLMLTVPENYLPGEVYDIAINLSRTGQSKWGFEMTALNGNGARAGTFAPRDGNTQLSEENSKQYIKHTFAGTATGKKDANSWTFKWTAPSTDVGPITFYAAGNAANADFSAAGDYIYTEEATSDVPPVYGVTLTGVGNLAKSTADASTGVTYTLRVTNTGNTDDVIRLSSSGSVNATLSRTSISLAAGASTNVTLTIPGSALTTAGNYAVKVTATSQGDSTKTAEITTTTTMLPIYGVTLVGIGNLTKETTDASAGVSYTLRVTNTANTNDTIRLATSGDATATVSPTSVFLNQGASRTVTLRVSGASLAKAGDYAVKVTATSQGNTTKTAAISTTTTILPVYGVTLAGVGNLTTETADASEGVSYTLRVTNTANTNDTIRLATSGDATATVSRTVISLAPGASSTVSVSIPGTALETAGDYAVKVTATSQGDNTKTAEVSTTTTILPVYGVTLVGVGELETETADASEGISYTLTITNTGNTDDVIDLATSDDDATLSQTFVSLASGASTNVTLAIPGTALATASEYVVKVTATSQGDSTKSAEVATTTTILPVYDVTLAGVGDLTTETADASEGISYTLTITNTGNTDDVIDLATSDDDASLSQTFVSLTSGASTNVTLAIPGTALATAGEYVVKVTATSQGDNTKSAEVATTTTILPVYGVALVGVGDLTTETADASEGVSYTLTITNTGNTDDIIDLATSDDDATLSQTFVSLTSGASTEVTLTISGDSLVTAGDYEVKVTATSQGDSTKTAEVSTTTTILPVYGVTLAGDNLTKQTKFANAGVSYALRVTNIGNTDDTIVLSSSAEVGIGGSVLGSFRKSKDQELSTSQLKITLAPGASTEVIFTATGDLLTKSGEYKIKVTAISQGDNTKSAEVATTTTILPVYDVTLAAVGDLITETANAAEGVSYTLTITNAGNTDDVIDLAITGDATAMLSESSVSLASGASTEVTLSISADALATAGDYEVKVTATSQGDNSETAEVSTTTTILPVYDVTLAAVGELTTETADATEGVSYTLTITNTGNTDDVIDLATSDDDASLSQTFVSLATGASAEVTLTISADALAKAGAYEVKVTATSQGDNSETAEVSTTTTILPVYGVTLVGEGELKGATMDMVAGVSYTLTVTNTGNTDDTIILGSSAEVGIGGSVLGSFRKSKDQELSTSQLKITLAPGASTEVIFTATGDLLTKSGEYKIKVTATSQGDNTKSAEVATTTTILPVYDVTLAAVGDLITETANAAEGVSYTLTITNAGNTDDVIDLAITGDATAMLSESSVSLASGASTEVTLSISADALATAGDYEVKVTATSQGDNSETAEVSTTTTILPVYDVTLAAVGELTTETADATEGVSYTLTITNTGNTNDVIDLATSGDATATLSESSVSLASGASTEVTLSISADVLAKAGAYEVKVTATSQGDNSETAEVSTTTTILPVYGVTLVGEGELKGATMDMVAGVSYTLTVTNTGNTDDTIMLGSSAEVGIEGSVLGSFTTSSDQEFPTSQLEIMLAPGASTDVTFTTAGDFFTKPGEYEIKVTATSQGDSTKTAEISTKTTIAPVPWDLNADGTVNVLDLVQVANQFGESGVGLAGDVNMDGQVNILDLVQVASYFGKTQAEIVQANQ